MRPLEILLSFANAFTLCAIAIPRFHILRLVQYIVPLALLVAGAQITIEGARWQMVPSYVLTGLIFSVWLLRNFVLTGTVGRVRTSHLVTALSAGLGALGLLVSIALPIALPVFHFPKPDGPYQIGTVSYHWVDTSRHEIFSTDRNARRELMAQAWYPVKGDTSSARAPYVVGADAISSGATNALSSGAIVRLPGFFFDDFEYVTTNSIPYATIATTKSNYPVLVYLTGLDGFRQVSTFQIESLVSHGYIVVGIDQPHTSAAVTFPDGQHVSGLTKGQAQPLIDQSVDPNTVAPILNGQSLTTGIIPYLAQDVTFTLNQLAALNSFDPSHILAGHLDLQHIGAFGVSLGAIVVGEACHEDQRLKACLMMDAPMTADVVRAGLKQPSMWMTRDAGTMRLERQRSGGWTEAEIQQTLTTMHATYAESSPGDGYYVQIPGLFHIQFTDAPYWSPFTSQLGLTGPINSQRGFDVINAYSFAFFNGALYGRPVILLDGALNKSLGVSVGMQRR